MLWILNEESTFNQPKFHQVLGNLQPFLTNTISIFQNRGHQSWRHHAVFWEWGLRDSKNLLGNGWDFGARSFSHRIPVANTVMTFMGFLRILSLPLHVQWLHPGLSRSPTNWYFNSLYSNCWSFRNPCTTPEIYYVKLSKNRISIKLWRNMKKQEWNHTQWTQRPWGCYVLSRTSSTAFARMAGALEVKRSE